jgi:hypothetical protein
MGAKMHIGGYAVLRISADAEFENMQSMLAFGRQ